MKTLPYLYTHVSDQSINIDHGLLSFPTWHRPYVAMMEQSILRAMLGIVNRDFRNSEVYQKAVLRFRLPYWDPFRPRGGQVNFPGIGPGGMVSFPYDFKLPEILNVANVTVLESETSTKLTSISNPLYQFAFPPSGSVSTQEWDWLHQNGQYYSGWTCRWPQDSPYDTSDVRQLNTTLNRARDQGVAQLVKIMTESDYKDWRKWSNHGPTGTNRDSVEGFHDQYHGNLGGDNGHMSIVPTAAFDPVFWLHHCNVDRLLAIYHAINPSVWWPSEIERTDPPSDSQLYPFRKAKTATSTEWWTSDTSKETTAFGYSYAELGLGDADTIAEEMAKRYRWSRLRPPPASPPNEMKVIDVTGSPFFLADGSNVPESLAPDTTRDPTDSRLEGLVSKAAADDAPAVFREAESSNPTGDTQGVLSSTDEEPKIPDGAETILEWYVDSEANRYGRPFQLSYPCLLHSLSELTPNAN